VARSCIDPPATDPTPIFELFRGSYASELLCAAVEHFHLFGHLAAKTMGFDELRGQLGLETRPARVLITAMRAMGLLLQDAQGRLDLSPIAREHLLGGPFDVSDYVGLGANSPGVLEMVDRLRSNHPAGAKPGGPGASFIYREGLESAMETETTARHLTLALAGRAKNVAPVLADKLPIENARTLLDVGGGTGIYSIALLQKHPNLHAIIFDRAQVLKVAKEMSEEYGVTDRLQLLPGDMFTDNLPPSADLILLSNILHDWDIPQCQTLINRCAAALPTNGQLIIHDVFLNDDLGGPLPLALYSAALFTLTEGRAYSAAEYRAMLKQAGLTPKETIPTLIHCGLLVGVKK
jgi:ubiquinone/menaquinone biosynthesis C-methylase UbiE